MSDLFVALGLVLVIEGLLYAGFPAGLKRMMQAALDVPEQTLRMGGAAAIALGVFIVWVARGF